jgi:hypothetical protein
MSLASPIQNPINLNQYPADEQGARCVKIILSGASNGFTINDDLTVENENGTITNVQSVFIDNSNNAGYFTLTMLETGQVISVPGLTQGFYPILCHQQVLYSATLSSVGIASAVNSSVILEFFNTPCQAAQWQSGFNSISSSVVSTVAGAIIPSITPGANQRAYVTGLVITGNGATAAGNIQPSLVSLTVNMFFNLFVPVIGTGATNFAITFPQPLPAKQLGLSAQLSIPSMGAGNTYSSGILLGFVR